MGELGLLMRKTMDRKERLSAFDPRQIFLRSLVLMKRGNRVSDEFCLFQFLAMKLMSPAIFSIYERRIRF